MRLICGIPNAGKTTYSKQFENVVEFDRVKGTNRQMREKVLEMVGENPDLTVEGVYGKAEDRRLLVNTAKGSRNTCIWLDTPLETCVERENAYRHRSEHLVVCSHEHFEPPTYAEGWDEIIILRGGGDDQGCGH